MSREPSKLVGAIVIGAAILVILWQIYLITHNLGDSACATGYSL
jgi:hypothetical protein